MSKGSGDAEVEGRASKLDSGYGEIVWVDHQLEGLFQCKGDYDLVADDATGVGPYRTELLKKLGY
jgi:hypothetical protein